MFLFSFFICWFLDVSCIWSTWFDWLLLLLLFGRWLASWRLNNDYFVVDCYTQSFFSMFSKSSHEFLLHYQTSWLSECSFSHGHRFVWASDQLQHEWLKTISLGSSHWFASWLGCVAKGNGKSPRQRLRLGLQEKGRWLTLKGWRFH